MAKKNGKTAPAVEEKKETKEAAAPESPENADKKKMCFINVPVKNTTFKKDDEGKKRDDYYNTQVLLNMTIKGEVKPCYVDCHTDPNKDPNVKTNAAGNSYYTIPCNPDRHANVRVCDRVKDEDGKNKLKLAETVSMTYDEITKNAKDTYNAMKSASKQRDDAAKDVQQPTKDDQVSL